MAERQRLADLIAAAVIVPPMALVARAYFDLEVTGDVRLLRQGSVVVAANHFSHLDPPLVTQAARRNVRFLAVDELFGRSRVFDAVTGFFGTIPIDRDGQPIQALRTALRHLEGGGIVGVFPEGRRVSFWGEDEPKRGAAWLAWMAGVPLVPLAIHGTEQTMAPGDLTFRRTAVRMWIGDPLEWSDYADCVDPLNTMMQDWHRWMDDRLRPWHGSST